MTAWHKSSSLREASCQLAGIGAPFSDLHTEQEFPMRLFLLSLTAPMLLAACSTTENMADRPKGVERYADDPRLGAPVDRICFASTIFKPNDFLTVRFVVSKIHLKNDASPPLGTVPSGTKFRKIVS